MPALLPPSQAYNSWRTCDIVPGTRLRTFRQVLQADAELGGSAGCVDVGVVASTLAWIEP